jgi:hypothetical protein
MEQNSSNILKEVKSWITPALLSFVSMMLYQDMQEMKSDIKLLLNQNAQDKVRIDNLETRFLRIEDHLYNKKTREASLVLPDFVLYRDEQKKVKPIKNA